VSGFVREALIEAGIATDEQITVRHGSVLDSGPPDEKMPATEFALAICPWERREKGLELLLPAWELRERPGKLIIVSGELATHEIGDVTFMPAIPRDMLMAMMGQAAFLIVPSIWHDPCPTVVIEALSRGTPVLATRMGGLPEIVDERCGWTVTPTIETLSIGIGRAFEEASGKRAGARDSYLERFTPEVSYERLMTAYGKAQAAKLVARDVVAQPMEVRL
jgi:glycosyltransferase involved in cell wall biosynthesis